MTASRICHHRPAMHAESQSCSQSFVPLDQQTKNDSSGSKHFRHTHACSEPDNQNSVISFVIFQNGCSQSSRFPTAGQEEGSSGNDIGRGLAR